VRYDGDAHIDGVPGTAAPIADRVSRRRRIKLCGALLPTGNVIDVVEGDEASRASTTECRSSY
jgi:4-oxalomesaconate tautomerase